MIRVKRRNRLITPSGEFENLVNYDKSKTAALLGSSKLRFENLVNYDKSKTIEIIKYIEKQFENLVNYDKSKTILF